MLNKNRLEIHFALHAVRQAALLVRQVQAELVSAALTKDDRSPVTVADFASQALIASLLMRAFPSDPLVAEEDSASLRQPENRATLENVIRFVSHFSSPASARDICSWIDRGAGEPSGRFWTLDPIDGTKGFLRGDQYAIALALIVEGQIEIGVLGCPNLREGRFFEVGGEGTLAVAAKGEGAWIAPLAGNPVHLKRVGVSRVADVTQARVLSSFESAHTNVSQIDQFAQILGTAVEPIRLDSQAKYVMLAAGAGELYLRLLSREKPDYKEKIWDQAAGSLLVVEAGGQITDLDNAPLDFSAGRRLARNRGILASNGYLHEPAARALRKINA